MRWFVFLKTTSLYKNTYGNAMFTGSLWAYRIKEKFNLEGSDKDLAETVLDFINWIVIWSQCYKSFSCFDFENVFLYLNVNLWKRQNNLSPTKFLGGVRKRRSAERNSTAPLLRVRRLSRWSALGPWDRLSRRGNHGLYKIRTWPVPVTFTL